MFESLQLPNLNQIVRTPPAQPVPEPVTSPETAVSASSPVVVAIDGPAGSGKTTLATAIAARLNAGVLHTGRHYRAVVLAAMTAELPLTSEQSIALMLVAHQPTIDDAGNLQPFAGKFHPAELESEAVDRAVGGIVNYESVRSLLVHLQQKWVFQRVKSGRSVVVEGRDACTRIAPCTPFRFFLDASVDDRVARRKPQRKDSFSSEIRHDLVRRDAADMGSNRTTATTPGVTVIDSGGLTLEETLERMWLALPPEVRQSSPTLGP